MEEEKIQELLKKVMKKVVISDYDLGVLNTLKWVLGGYNPYDGRVERA